MFSRQCSVRSVESQEHVASIGIQGKHKASSELRTILALCWPTCSCSMLMFLLQFVNMLGAGRLGTTPLASVSLANSYYNIVVYFLMGAATAIDTTVSQAYGRGKPTECRQWLLRSLVVFSIACIPFCWGLMLANTVFRSLNIDAEIAGPAADYIVRTVPGTPFFVLFVCFQKYQQAMNLMSPSLIVLVIGNLANCIFTWYSVAYGSILDLAWSLTYARIILCALMAFAVYVTPQQLDAVRVAATPVCHWASLRSFLGLGISGAFMQGLEAMAFELTTFAAATQGRVALDAHNLLIQITALTYLSLPLGISIAASIRVGNLLGAGHADLAKLSSSLCIGIGCSVMIISGICVMTYRDVIGYIFTTDENVVRLIASLAPIAAFFQTIDGFQGVSGGVLRAMGKQSYLAVCIFIAFYVISLPMGFSLCFSQHWGIAGLWYGLASGLGLMAVAFGVNIFCLVDWHREASLAQAPPDRTKPLLASADTMI